MAKDDAAPLLWITIGVLGHKASCNTYRKDVCVSREGQIIRTSAVNVVGNVVLAITKGVVGTVTGSVSISMDAVNSLVDALSSVVAIIGARIASRNADQNHPFGYGRIEYLASNLIAALILGAGVSALTEALRSLAHPTKPEYTVIALVIVSGAAVLKFVLGFYLKSAGKRLKSSSLVGSGTDSLMDGFVSLATLVSGILYMTLGIDIESWLAAGIALLIIKSGTSLLIEAVSKLLGERVNPRVASKVEKVARSVDGVRLANDVILTDFGPDKTGGTIHVTVDGTMTIAEFDSVARAVHDRVLTECGVMLVGVTPYPDISDDEEVRKVRADIGRIVWSHEHVVELRGLYVDPITSIVRFDAIASFDTPNRDELHAELVRDCSKLYPDWSFEVRTLPDIGD